MSYILFHKETEIIGVHKKQPNRTYHTQFQMEEIETEELLISRIKEIDENYVYKTEAERLEEMQRFMNNEETKESEAAEE